MTSSVSSKSQFQMAFWSAISLLWFKVPGLLSKSVIRGKKSKINRSIRQKMAEFYHEVLWQGVGELSEPYLLWNNSVPLDLASSPPTATENNFDYSRKEYLPFGMQHPRLSLGLCGLVQETLAAPIGGDSLDLPAICLGRAKFLGFLGGQCAFFYLV